MTEACFLSLTAEKDRLSKGKEIAYDTLKTQPYLSPEANLSAEEMRRIYHIRNREIFLKANFPSAFPDTKCVFPTCSDRDEQLHIFNSTCFSGGSELTNQKVPYESIFGSNINEQCLVMQIFFSKLERRIDF